MLRLCGILYTRPPPDALVRFTLPKKYASWPPIASLCPWITQRELLKSPLERTRATTEVGSAGNVRRRGCLLVWILVDLHDVMRKGGPGCWVVAVGGVACVQR